MPEVPLRKDHEFEPGLSISGDISFSEQISKALCFSLSFLFSKLSSDAKKTEWIGSGRVFFSSIRFSPTLYESTSALFAYRAAWFFACHRYYSYLINRTRDGIWSSFRCVAWLILLTLKISAQEWRRWKHLIRASVTFLCGTDFQGSNSTQILTKIALNLYPSHYQCSS